MQCDDISEHINNTMANPDPQQQGKLPLPIFSAEGISASAISMDAEQFLTRFEDWATVCGYTDGRKAKALGYALTKAAATWYQQSCRRGKVSMDDWTAVETAFKDRFVKVISPKFIAAEIAKLSQRHKESVADYFDRCVLAQTLLDEQWAIAAGATNRADRLEVVDQVHQAMVLHHFLRHLRPEIGDKLAFCQNLNSLDDHVKAAERIEKAGMDKAFNAAAAGNVSSVDTASVAAFNAAAPLQKKKKRPPPPGYICRLCGVKGHFINECPKSDKQMRKGGGGGGGGGGAGRQPEAPPPRQLGAIPKQQWQRPPQHQQAAIGIAGGPFSPPPAQFQQQPAQFIPQQFQPAQGYQPIYPQLPAGPDMDVSNMSIGSPDWPAPTGFRC